MTRLILIRHAETDYSVSGRYCGVTDPSLNDRGRDQAGRLRDLFAHVAVDAVYASDLKRASETATIVFPTHTIHYEETLREMHFGIFEGKTYDELMAEHRDTYVSWMENVLSAVPPQGESCTALWHRVSAAVKKISQIHRKDTVALVTHGGPLCVMLCDAWGYPRERFWDVGLKRAGFIVVDVHNDGSSVVHRENDITVCDEKKVM